MTPTLRKQAERQRRKADGQVEFKGWLGKEDHAALTQMARDSGMTQGQVVSKLIGMRSTSSRVNEINDILEDFAERYIIEPTP